MARRKKTKRKAKKKSFKLGASKKKKRKINVSGLKGILIVLAVVCVLGGAVVGLRFLDRYVKRNSAISRGSAVLELVDVPKWVSKELKNKIYIAAVAGGEDLKIDDDVASSVQRNIETYVAWLDAIKVQATSEVLVVSGRWRKPLGLVKRGLRKYYVDADLVVLDFIPVSKLPIVNINGLPLTAKAPLPGDIWERDDLAAAVDILSLLDQRDKLLTSEKPLLYEINRIDVSNYNGRQDSRLAHIMLYTNDNTEIIWGAEIGAWQRYLESPDEDKLAKLYGYYEEYGSLGDLKCINLRDPQDSIPQPIDKY